MKRNNRKSAFTNFDTYYTNIKTNRNNFLKRGKKKALQEEFYNMRKEHLDFDNIKTFNEKIYMRKIENKRIYKIISDKYKVRSYVVKKLKTDKYLIPLVFVGKTGKFTEKDYEKLPSSCILKTTNGSGTNIILNKKNADKEDVVATMNEYISIPFRWISMELFYPKKARVIAEKLILDRKNGTIPKDYKFHCFGNGKIIIQVDSNRFGNHSRNFYDEDWNLLEFQLGIKNGTKDEKPKKLNEMIKIAKKLSEDFRYIRVDLYYINKKIYFGELTLTHGGGNEKFAPEKYDEILGKYWA